MKLSAILAFLITAQVTVQMLPSQAMAGMQDACLPTEHWSIPKSTNWLHEFHEFTSQRSSAIYGFSQALQLKRMSQIMNSADFEHDFSEYWVARILFELKLDPLAHQAMSSVFESTQNLDIKKAAFSCMARIQVRSPDWKAPAMSKAQDITFDANGNDSDIAFLSVLGRESTLIKKLSPGHKGFAEGFNALERKDYTGAILGFKTYFQYLETHNNPLLSRYADDGHLLLGRAYYSVARFPEAYAEFQHVTKTSNYQIEAMSNLAWAYLMAEKYDDAVGVSLQMRSGTIKNTFAPEPIMVAAMGLNELCNFPDSIRMIEAFNKDYEPIYNWLAAHKNIDNGYVLSVKALKGSHEFPTKLATEWIRSPEFLTRQKEINFLLDEPKQVAAIEAKGRAEQIKLTEAFISRETQFVKDVRTARLKLKPGEVLSMEYSQRYAVLKKDLRKLSRFYKASRTWKTLARAYEKKIPGLKKDLVELVNKDFNVKNRRMLSLLNKVKDNTDLIEVEIYNGASQDLVWKSVHPDFQKMEKNIDQVKDAPDSAKTYNWGRFLASNIENAEVWEDELGALKADVANQCDKKEKYLKLKLMKRE